MDFIYDDTCIPTLVPPEEYLVPQLVPPDDDPIPQLIYPTIEIIEVPVEVPVEVHVEVPVEILVEVPVEVRVEVPARNQQSLPQYILNGYIENIVTKKESCPILMTELALDTTCITPCGHAMSKEGLDSWFQTSQTCPVCRTAFLQDQLQTWK